MGKRLAAHNLKKREQKAQSEAKSGASGVRQYYSIGGVIAVGVIGGLGYYIYRIKHPLNTQPSNPHQQPSHQCPQTNKFEMD